MIGTIEVGYQFDDVDNETVPGLNESRDFPAQTATTTAPTSVAIESNQLKAVVLSNDDNFAYFAALAVPHPVSFVINATGAKAGQASHGMSPAPGISSPQRALLATTRCRTRRSISANCREKLRRCRATRLSTRLCSRLMTRRRWLSVRQCRQLSRLRCGCMCWSSSARRPAQRNTGLNFGRLMTIITGAGTSEQYDYSFDNDFQVTTRYFRTTHKFVPAAGAGRYAVTIERLDNSNDANVVTLMAIHAVNVRENVVYPEDTIARITIKGSNDSNSNREQKYNMLAQRHTISYDRTTGAVDYTLRPSRSFADAILHEWVVVGKQDVASIDVAALYAIADSLPDEALGYFDYTFSDEKQPLGERIATIANVARVDGNNIGDVLTFWRDERVANPDAVLRVLTCSGTSTK
nr:Uncharacterised protein [Klebsiella pneumoniae]